MKTLLAGLALLFLTACAPVRYVEVDEGYSPWYTYCTWDYPCYYNEVVFIYGWGYFPHDRYVYFVQYPMYRPRAGRPHFFPRDYPSRVTRSEQGRHEGREVRPENSTRRREAPKAAPKAEPRRRSEPRHDKPKQKDKDKDKEHGRRQ